MDKLLTVNEVAEKLRIQPATVREWIRTGKLKADQLPGGDYRITEAATIALLKAA